MDVNTFDDCGEMEILGYIPSFLNNPLKSTSCLKVADLFYQNTLLISLKLDKQS